MPTLSEVNGQCHELTRIANGITKIDVCCQNLHDSVEFKEEVLNFYTQRYTSLCTANNTLLQQYLDIKNDPHKMELVLDSLHDELKAKWSSIPAKKWPIPPLKLKPHQMATPLNIPSYSANKFKTVFVNGTRNVTQKHYYFPKATLASAIDKKRALQAEVLALESREPQLSAKLEELRALDAEYTLKIESIKFQVELEEANWHRLEYLQYKENAVRYFTLKQSVESESTFKGGFVPEEPVANKAGLYMPKMRRTNYTSVL